MAIEIKREEGVIIISGDSFKGDVRLDIDRQVAIIDIETDGQQINGTVTIKKEDP